MQVETIILVPPGFLSGSRYYPIRSRIIVLLAFFIVNYARGRRGRREGEGGGQVTKAESSRGNKAFRRLMTAYYRPRVNL